MPRYAAIADDRARSAREAPDEVDNGGDDVAGADELGPADDETDVETAAVGTSDELAVGWWPDVVHAARASRTLVTQVMVSAPRRTAVGADERPTDRRVGVVGAVRQVVHPRAGRLDRLLCPAMVIIAPLPAHDDSEEDAPRVPGSLHLHTIVIYLG
jgi:hypothetical protein